ncbi:MAG: type VI secretion system needle protein Hcp [Prevotellaceae bacterium]|jgi:hypothetical protein|nr:type VI secretion system needle protein Hcp [Prevotellaceae bacterium]
MFGYKSFLRIGELADASIAGLYKDSYELESCSYGFSQGIDTDGKAQTDVYGGAIYITYSGLPTNEMLQWALASHKYYDGTIIICDENEQPLEKIKFEQAACVGLEINYSQKGNGYINTKLILQAFQISAGAINLLNRWTGF